MPDEVRKRLEKVLAEVRSILDENMDEFESDWHGYVGEANGGLLLALGDPTGRKHYGGSF